METSDFLSTRSFQLLISTETRRLLILPEMSEAKEPLLKDTEEAQKETPVLPQNAENSVQEVSLSPTASNSSLQPAQEAIDQQTDAIIKNYVEACQSGNLVLVKELIESGAVEIGSDFDVNNVSGLHWAAINNRLSIVQYLLSKGSKVDTEGGELNATPLHWACRYGLVYIVDALLKAGADPNKVDSQGFNALHLAIHSSNIMLVIYILIQTPEVDIDSTDPNNRTALHWAAYQGDSLSVDVLLKHKASVRKVDNQGFLPIHWALIRGQKDCLKRLIEEGSDIQQQTNEGKTCFDIAQDMNSTKALTDALHEAGFKVDGTPIPKYFDEKWAKVITFFYPYLLLGVLLKIAGSSHIIFTLLVAIALYFISDKLLNTFVFPSYVLSNTPIIKSPFLSGIFSGTAFWVVIVWFTVLLPYTFSEAPISNLFFLAFAIPTVYCFQQSMFKNPGLIYPPEKDEEIKEIIGNLLEEGKFDAKHFCIHTFVRKPLRSKYSSFSQKCVARFDHYCPWVYNDVGLRNHKVFMFFVLSLEFAILLFLRLVAEYFDEIEDDDITCSFLNQELCSGWNFSPFTFLLSVWVAFQLIWLTFLVFSQFFQISKGITTLELSLVTKRSDLGANPYYSSAPAEMLGTDPSALPTVSGGPVHKNCFSTLFLLTGLNQFVIAIRQTLGFKDYIPMNDIPFDYGLKQNLIDFWFASGDDTLKFRNFLKLPANGEASLGGQVVDYYKLYTLPEKINYEAPV